MNIKKRTLLNVLNNISFKCFAARSTKIFLLNDIYTSPDIKHLCKNCTFLNFMFLNF